MFHIKSIDIETKKKELKEILGINNKSELKTVHEFPVKNGWKRLALETNEKRRPKL